MICPYSVLCVSCGSQNEQRLTRLRNSDALSLLGSTNGICDYNSGQSEYLSLADDTCEASKQKLWLSDVGNRWLVSTAQAASEYMTKMFVKAGEAGLF